MSIASTSDSSAGQTPAEEALALLGAAGARRASEAARRMFAVDTAGSAPRLIDPLPFVIEATEWEELVLGLSQRARLLDALLADLYGPRAVFASGVLPPSDLLTDPAYLRTAVGLPTRGAHRLFTLACTLTRMADGTWAVLEDETDVPGGAGEALEMRRVLSRSAPALYSATPLRRLHPFFETMRSALHARSRSADRAGRTAVLIDDADSLRTFDHHRFANLLGAPAVSATDLVIHDGAVTLPGPALENRASVVDTVVRLVPSARVDPLDLGPTPLGGVTGLVEAARRGAVEVLNPIGAGILENAALRAALPDLCRLLLHEDLRLRAPAPGGERELLASLDPSCGDAPLHRPVTVKLLVVATGAGFDVLPGGTALTDDELPAAMKDVWVRVAGFPLEDDGEASSLVSGPESAAGPAGREGSPGSAERDSPDRSPTSGRGAIIPALAMTQSAGSDLFWFGRYMDRVDSTARLLRVIRDSATDLESERGPDARTALAVLLRAVTDVTGTPPGMHAIDLADTAAVRAELQSVLTDADRPGSLAQSFRALERTARSLRDMVTDEVWPILDRMHHDLLELRSPASAPQELVLRDVVGSSLALVGVVADGMQRTLGWDLLEAGRRIERSLSVLTLVRAGWGERRSARTEGRVSAAMATITDSSAAYRRTYEAPLQPELLLELLLGDATLPRSLAFQVEALRGTITRLPEISALSEGRAHLADLTARIGAWQPRALLAPVGGAGSVGGAGPVGGASTGSGALPVGTDRAGVPTALVAEATGAITSLRQMASALEDEYFRTPETSSTWGDDDV